MNALDLAQIIDDATVKALKAKGYGAIGVYLRPDRCNKAMIDAIHANGLKVFSIFEHGQPTDPRYFSADQGKRDGQAAESFALQIGQPSKSWIFTAFDYDSSLADIDGCNWQYFQAFDAELAKSGYQAGAYGNGVLCQTFQLRQQYNRRKFKGFLPGSTGFGGYRQYKTLAAIVQGQELEICGLDVDLDVIRDLGVLW
jgi:hypothetical protein